MLGSGTEGANHFHRDGVSQDCLSSHLLLTYYLILSLLVSLQEGSPLGLSLNIVFIKEANCQAENRRPDFQILLKLYHTVCVNFCDRATSLLYSLDNISFLCWAQLC